MKTTIKHNSCGLSEIAPSILLWVKQTLAALPLGSRLLGAGGGELKNRPVGRN